MDLQTHLVHLRNKSVQVGTTHYDVDAVGIIRGLSAQDAQALLAHGGAWHHVHPKTQPGAPAPIRAPRAPFKANFVQASAPRARDEPFPQADIPLAGAPPVVASSLEEDPAEDALGDDASLDDHDAQDVAHDPSNPTPPAKKRRRRK